MNDILKLFIKFINIRIFDNYFLINNLCHKNKHSWEIIREFDNQFLKELKNHKISFQIHENIIDILRNIFLHELFQNITHLSSNNNDIITN